jgi:glycosyltransferase involved in cell wall biosynthesis
VKKNRISVVIPTYNREHLINECLQSATDINYDDLEIIVIDNASNDRTVELAKKFASKDDRIRVIVNSENIGPVENWRRGAENATGEYVKILFSDDLVNANFLFEAIKYMTYPSVGFVYSGVELIGSMSGELYCKWKKKGLHKSNSFLSEIVREGKVPYSPCCALMRRKDFLSALQTDFEGCNHRDFASHGAGSDVSVFVNLAFKYKNFAYLPEPLHSFRAHTDSITISDMTESPGIGKVQWRTRSAVLSLVRFYCNDFTAWLVANCYYYQTRSEIRTDSDAFYLSLGVEKLPNTLSPIIGKSARILLKYFPNFWSIIVYTRLRKRI